MSLWLKHCPRGSHLRFAGPLWLFLGLWGPEVQQQLPRGPMRRWAAPDPGAVAQLVAPQPPQHAYEPGHQASFCPFGWDVFINTGTKGDFLRKPTHLLLRVLNQLPLLPQVATHGQHRGLCTQCLKGQSPAGLQSPLPHRMSQKPRTRFEPPPSLCVTVPCAPRWPGEAGLDCPSLLLLLSMNIL